MMKVILIGLGTLCLLICLGIFGFLMRVGEPPSCENEAQHMKEYESAVENYKTAKSKGKKDDELYLERGEIKQVQELLNISGAGCYEQQSNARLAKIIAGLLGFLGVVMLAASFLLGRKKAVP